MLNAALIVGSTRPNRFADAVAKWVIEGAKARNDLHLDVLDLRDHPLPFFNEPAPVGYTQGRFSEPAWVPGRFATQTQGSSESLTLSENSPHPRNLLEALRQLDVLGGDFAAGIVRVEADGDAIVDIGPVRVVVHCLGLEGDAGHEGKRLAKAAELEILGQGIAR